MKNKLNQLQANMAVLFPGVANAATAPTNILSSKQKVVALLCTTVDWMFWGLISLAVIMFLVGGYTYATAGDKVEKVSKANKTLLYAAVAVIVGILAKGIPTLIASFIAPGTDLSAC